MGTNFVFLKMHENTSYEPVRHELVRLAELVCLALNRFSRVFLKNLAKIASNLTKKTDFDAKSWINAENI